MSTKVFVFAPVDPTGDNHKKLEDAGCELTFGKASWHTPGGDNEDEMIELAKDAHALCGTSIRSSPITRRIMESCPDLRIVAKYSIGTDDVDVAAATEMGILVTHSPTESNWGGVAEGTVAMMLTQLKKTREKDEVVRAGKWRDTSTEGVYLGRRQDGHPGITLGLIGMGRIGSRVSELMKPWRIRMIGYDPHVPPARFALTDVERMDDLDTLLAESDVVSVHVTLTDETYHMIGAAQFARMKPSCLFINTSRGKAVDEAALYQALRNDQIASAAIDVFEDEPLPAESPLRGLGNKVVLSPHSVSFNVGSGLGAGVGWSVRSVLSALNGDVPDNVFNPEVIPKWRERFGGRPVSNWPSNR
jgi:D-3-phosphoglycerate dehydrogenase